MARQKKPRYKNGIVVTKDNKLVRIHANMTPMSYRLTNLILWKAVKENKFNDITIKSGEIKELLGLKSNRLGQELKDECKRVAETVIEIQDKIDPEKWSFWNVIPSVSYNNGILNADVNLNILSYIKDLGGNFTMVEMRMMSACGSYSAMRLYEVCLSWKRVGKITYSVDEWRKLIGATKVSYDVFAQFKRRIWEPAVNYVNQRTNLNLTPFYTRDGRSVTAITVKIAEKKFLGTEEAPLLSSGEPATYEQESIIQELYEKAGASPGAVRAWRKKYPEEALRWLLGKIKQAKPRDVGAWLGAACKDGGWLMNAYETERQEEKIRFEKMKNTAYFALDEISPNAEPIPFNLDDEMEKIIVGLIKSHLEEGSLSATTKKLLIEHKMQPAEFVRRYCGIDM